MTYVRLAVLLVSYWGYYRALCVWTRMERTFIPMFVLSAQAVLIFLAGLAGGMYPMACALYFGGCAALAASFIPRLGGGRRADYPLGLWLLMALTAYAVFLLRGKLLTYNDDFSHWGLIARVLLENDALPGAQDVLVTFSSYPPGTACFIYYVCRMVTGGAACEWGMMMAQAALLLSCVAPLTALVKKVPWCALPAALVMAWFCIGTGVGLCELMVDSVMPMMAVGCIAFIARNAREESGRFWEAALLAPLGLLVLVKNSAFLFAAFVLLSYLAFRRPRTVRGWLKALALVLPMALLPLWRAYAVRVDPGALRSMHAMSGDYFGRILADKTVQDVLDTVHLLKERTMGEGYVAFVLAAGLVAALALRLARVRLDAHARLLPWLNILFYGLYQFGLLCMYVVSMHVVEASLLIQYERYESSIRLLITGVLIVYGLCAAQTMGSRYPRARLAACAAALAVCAGCVAVGQPSVEALRPEDQSRSLRVRMEAVLDGCPRGADLRYLQAISSPDLRADAHYCARYLLWNPNVRTANVYEGVYDEAWYESAWRDYDYLIVLDHYPAVDAFVEQHYPDQAGQQVIALQ